MATSLAAAALLAAGALAYGYLPVAPLPRVDFPTVAVWALLPGGSPETMASSVAAPLERRFARIAGLSELTSSSTEGRTTLTLQFDLDRDIDGAARDVQAAIDAAAGDLPKDLPQLPNWRKVNPANSSILVLGVSSQTLPLGVVYDQANTILAQKISQIAGVGQVFVGGGQQPAIRIQVDTQALADLGLGMEDVRALVGQATVDQPKGSLSGPSESLSLADNDQIFVPDSYRNLVLSRQNGAVVRLGDVARVVESTENVRVAAWTDRERGIVILVKRQPGANMLEVIDRIRAELPELRASISPAIDVRVVLDRSRTLRASIASVDESLLASVVLVVLVVFLFLRRPRAALIPCVAMPLSLLGTFGVMWLLGLSRDNVSLMALTVAAGFVVDDAIVVTENVLRRLEGGATPLAAALDGAKQVGVTVVSITAALLAALLPVFLLGGVVGRLFRELAFTLGTAIALSALVSLTLTPAMCARLLMPPRAAEAPAGGVWRWLLRAYDAALGGVLRFRGLALAAALLVTLLTGALLWRVPKGLFPREDTGQLVGYADAPQSISFPAMRDRQRALNTAVLTDPDVEHVISVMGAWGAGTLNTGEMLVQLVPRADRKATADEVIARLRPKLAQIEGISLYLQPVQDMQVGGRLARSQYQYTLEDPDLHELDAWAPRVLAKLQTLPQLREVASDQQTAGLEVEVDVDRDTASRLGVSLTDVDDALYDDFGQRQVATTYTGENQYHVILEALPKLQATPDELGDVYVRSS
ncbi:MAG TPA: efflux RND transporter permease subunit, partial [Myxococcales bacterium]|nr:efflux RND transporter permease subunit [Myxococcales bacterium]